MDEFPEGVASEDEFEPPVAELLQLPDETEDDFLDRLRRVIGRRLVGSHIVDICIVGSALVFLQMLFMAGQFTGRERDPGGHE